MLSESNQIEEPESFANKNLFLNCKSKFKNRSQSLDRLKPTEMADLFMSLEIAKLEAG